MTDLAGISIHDVAVDFACGSGGFLIKAFEQMQRGVEQLPLGTLQRLGASREDLLEDIKSHQLFGIDAEPRAARTAKMNMLMWGDGRRVVRGNALDTKDMAGHPYDHPEYDERNQGSGCTLILANSALREHRKRPGDTPAVRARVSASGKGRGEHRGPFCRERSQTAAPRRQDAHRPTARALEHAEQRAGSRFYP